MAEYYDGNYKTKYKAGPIYKIDYFTIFHYRNPELRIFGETRCGLAFILQVNEERKLAMSFQKTLDECTQRAPNYYANLKEFKNIDQRTIYNVCYDEGFCVFAHSKVEYLNEWQQDNYKRWKVEPRFKEDRYLLPRKKPKPIRIIKEYVRTDIRPI